MRHLLYLLFEAAAFFVVLTALALAGAYVGRMGASLQRGVGLGIAVHYTLILFYIGLAVQITLTWLKSPKVGLLVALCLIAPVVLYAFPYPRFDLNEHQFNDESWKPLLGEVIGGIGTMVLFARWRMFLDRRAARAVPVKT